MGNVNYFEHYLIIHIFAITLVINTLTYLNNQCMKRFLSILLLSAIAFIACEKFDDSKIWDELRDHESRITKLEELCKQMNTNISSLQTIISALQENDYVTNVSPVTENGVEIGYTISFAKGKSITIYHGKDGKDGEDGEDGKDSYTPVIGVKQDNDGNWYWTLDGEWLLDSSGNKISAQNIDSENASDAVVPQLKVEDNFWYVSCDGGKNWSKIKEANGDTTGSMFQYLKQDDMFVYFSLSDGTVIKLPLAGGLSIIFDSNDLVVMGVNSTREIGYEVESVIKEIVVETVCSSDIKANAIADENNPLKGKIKVTTGAAIDEYSKVVVLVSNGEKVIMRTLKFEEEQIEVVDNNIKSADATGGELELEYLSNVECEVVIPEEAKSWISVIPSTKALEKRTVTLKLEPNAGANRKAVVVIQSSDKSLQLEYNITQEATIDYQLKLEREALIAIYSALDGDNWPENRNWCSDKPVGEWSGIEVDEHGRVHYLNLNIGNAKGEIPSQISNLSRIQKLFIFSNIIEVRPQIWEAVNNSSIPESIFHLKTLTQLSITGFSINAESFISLIGQLSDLEYLNLGYNHLSGNGGETLRALTKLTELRDLTISNNPIYTSIPSDFSHLSNLRYLNLPGNGLTGEIPESLCTLTGLERLDLNDNKLSGEIPNSIGNLKNIKYLNLSVNNLSGSIPKSIANLNQLEVLYLNSNYLSGTIPQEVINMPNWDYHCWYCIFQNCFSDDGLHALKTPEFSVECIDKTTYNSKTEFEKNKYTILHQSSLLTNDDFLDGVKRIYDKYKDHGVDVLTWISYDTAAEQNPNLKDEFASYVNNKNIPWNCFFPTSTNNFFAPRNLLWARHYPILFISPNAVVIDNEGKIVFYTIGDIQPLEAFFERYMAGSTPDIYSSTDYSRDGEVKQLQKATKGNGIDIIFTCDGYSDRLINDGSFDNTINFMAEQFFKEKPYKSYREFFNVYSVKAISLNEEYSEHSSTVFDCYFGEGTYVGGNDRRVFSYALKAVPANRIDDALIIVALNSDKYSGTCFMYIPERMEGDYGRGAAISYFTKGGDESSFTQLLHHEANGHGFAKLADEYAYEYMGAISETAVADYKSHQTNFGWWKNADFTNDTSTIRWNYFINDSRYANEGLGAFEGGLTYWTGVWRPSENSIMRYNTGGFNAPSREAIYYRIHKLAYGDEWEYDYEKFVEYDAINRASTPEEAAAKAHVARLQRTLPPTAPPVIVNKSWKEVMSEER